MDENSNRTVASIGPPEKSAPPAEDWSGRAVGEFHIRRLLGRGGMGQVYLAEQTSLKRKVAVKMLRPELAANHTALQRFRAEAEAVARLNHANIVQIYHIGEQDGVHYMVLEYVEGRNLRDYLNRKGPPDVTVCLSLMRQMSAALQRAHEAGFIHRDVKPENILLTRKGEVKVTDFGLSRCFSDDGQKLNLTQSGVAMGTPLYMSPEQVQGKPVDPRTDIYSFGVTCFHLLAGTPPFRGTSAFDVAVQHVQNQPPALAELRPDLPPELCAMVHRMMAKAPEDRYASFKDILRDLNKVRDLIAGGVTLQPLSVPSASNPDIMTVFPETMSTGFENAATEYLSLSRRRPKRRNWFPWVIAGVVVGGMFLGGVAVRLLRHPLPAREPGLPGAAEKSQPALSGEERFALEASRQFADPNTADRRELKKGLDFQIDLAAYYFKHHRLTEAERFFHDLQDRKYKSMPSSGPHPYQAFARLGQALVLAFRDQSSALDQLGKLITPVPRPAITGGTFQIGGVSGAMFDHPDLRRLLAEALNRLALDLKVDHFEKYPLLDSLRKASANPLQPSRAGKT